MISILIPVFNFDISELASDLSNQLVSTGSDSEIIIMDDGSDKRFTIVNSKLSHLPNVSYHELPANVGRSKIRRLLAEKASFEWLLFLDCDSKIITHNFFSAYVQKITDATDVIIGGRKYYSSIPTDCRYRLHWKYGTNREAVFYKGRPGSPYRGFISNNFLIRSETFQKLEFFETLRNYGHEDTWIGIQLEHIRAKISFIDNPVLHDRLEKAEEFIQKAEFAAKNLVVLSSKLPSNVLKEHVKMYRYHLQFRKLGLTSVLSRLLRKLEGKILKNLHSCNPSLFLFDMYRLNILINLQKETAHSSS